MLLLRKLGANQFEIKFGGQSSAIGLDSRRLAIDLGLKLEWRHRTPNPVLKRS